MGYRCWSFPFNVPQVYVNTGRSLLNSVFNLGIKDQYAQALSELGYNLEVVVEQVSFSNTNM